MSDPRPQREMSWLTDDQAVAPSRTRAPLSWQDAAHLVGHRLRKERPVDYYDFTAEQWQAWMLAALAEVDAVLRARDEALVEARVQGHGEGQEHAIADTNAGLIDDLIAPRLTALREQLAAAQQHTKVVHDHLDAIHAPRYLPEGELTLVGRVVEAMSRQKQEWEGKLTEAERQRDDYKRILDAALRAAPQDTAGG